MTDQKKRPGYISRAELLEAALKDPEFRQRYEVARTPFSLLLVKMQAEAHLTGVELASKSGIGNAQISALKMGSARNMTWNTMARLAKACGFRLVLTAEREDGDAPDAAD